MIHRSRIDDQDESPQAKKRKREEFERERARSLRVRNEARRNLFAFFKLWTVCVPRARARLRRLSEECAGHDKREVCAPPMTRVRTPSCPPCSSPTRPA